MIKKQAVIDILKRINVLLIKGAYFEAREYIRIEIENLEGKTPKKCKNEIGYCKICRNINCPNNKSVKKD